MFRDSFWGLNGFDELRKYIKQGNVFCQEVAVIMQERSDMENVYGKTLSKLSAKLTKACAGCLGSLASSWSLVATEMEREAEYHRALGQGLHENVYRPLKVLAEQQHKTRKPIEAMVDKSLKSFVDKRSEEAKCKKLAFNAAKEREKLCDQLHNAKSGKGKPFSEKEIAKLEKKVRTLYDTIQKADKEYMSSGITSEQCREEWETCVYKGSAQLQSLEEERIIQMQEIMSKYNQHLSELSPQLQQSCDRLSEAVISINMNEDLRLAVDKRGTGPNQPEQLLLDYYAEDLSHTMDKMRRKQALQNYMLYLQQEIDKEKKGREGLERLIDVYQNRPSFADSDTQEETRQRLAHMAAMLSYVEACFWKVAGAIDNMENKPMRESKYTQYTERTKDKTGCMVSILRLPIHILTNGYCPPPQEVSTNSMQPPSNGIDENFVRRFRRRGSTGSSVSSISSRSSKEQSLRLRRLSQASARKSVAPVPPQNYADMSTDEDEFDDTDFSSPHILGSCRAIYDYAAQHYDELTIKPGDVINIYNKQEDGWWQGELQGRVGIFPATYVEELGAMV